MAHRYNTPKDIEPDEILGDSLNIPGFREEQFEGRLEKPLSLLAPTLLTLGFIFLAIIYIGRAGILQIIQGDSYTAIAEANNLRQIPVFAERGVIYDRNLVELAWNRENKELGFSLRTYKNIDGLAHIVGYVSEPKRDLSGKFWQTESLGIDGVEKYYDELLKGKNGSKLIETNVQNEIISESGVRQAESGKNITLSIDSRVQEKFYTILATLSENVGFRGGAGAIMDVTNGELIALVSYPEYSQGDLVSGDDTRAINRLLIDKRTPFLNRAVSGLYAPGSTIKPIIAFGALTEKVIDPSKKILSTGSISVPNPYDPSKPTVFKDWKAHGWVNMREAIAHSSDVYFYEIGGGFEGQKGIGILGIERYARLFGFGEKTGIDLPNEQSGVIPNPEWKEKNFNGEKWLVGNTYHTAIGQYGFQVTPLELLRAINAIATDGLFVTPHVKKEETNQKEFPTTSIGGYVEYYKIIREGMRQGVLEGTASGLSTGSVALAAKTGTAELGFAKEYVNSWATGFFPYENPRYAFVVVMERGPRGNTLGGVYVMRQLLDWMALHTPEYLKKTE